MDCGFSQCGRGVVYVILTRGREVPDCHRFFRYTRERNAVARGHTRQKCQLTGNTAIRRRNYEGKGEACAVRTWKTVDENLQASKKKRGRFGVRTAAATCLFVRLSSNAAVLAHPFAVGHPSCCAACFRNGSHASGPVAPESSTGMATSDDVGIVTRPFNSVSRTPRGSLYVFPT